MPVDISIGSSPLILSIPHASTQISHPVMQRMNETGRAMTDTAWHIDRLFRDVVPEVTTVRANFHRYLCDPNRDPTNTDPHGRSSVTVIVPMQNLDGQMIWDQPPDKVEVARWRLSFHAPYHAALATQIARVRAKHGYALLLDCLATRSELPRISEGVAPDFSIGTNMGASCDQRLAAHVAGILMGASTYRSAVNGRSKGGWTVQTYGQPRRNMHALQMEVSLATYLTEEADPWLYDPDKAEAVRDMLKRVLTYLQNWHPK